MLQASPLTRSFAYLSLKLPDPDSKLTVEEVRQFYSTQFPDLATASITGPESRGRQACVFVLAAHRDEGIGR